MQPHHKVGIQTRNEKSAWNLNVLSVLIVKRERGLQLSSLFTGVPKNNKIKKHKDDELRNDYSTFYNSFTKLRRFRKTAKVKATHFAGIKNYILSTTFTGTYVDKTRVIALCHDIWHGVYALYVIH